MYTAEAYLLNPDNQNSVSLPSGGISSDLDYQNETGIREDIDTTGGDLLSLIQFISFTSPELPTFMKLVLAPVTTIFLIVALYLTIDIIYDIVKALPFT
jgi:hypothetical protein